jgi:hypothetical protein
MLVKLLAFLLLIGVTYIGIVFIAPTLADRYGNAPLNKKFRSLKSASEIDTVNSGASLYDRASNIAKPYIDESRATATQIQTTIDTKTEQAKEAAETARKAYEAAQEAKKSFDTLTNFGSGK